MRKMKVRDSRIIYVQKFILPGTTRTAITREYLLPGDRIVFERYVIWQSETVDVVMLGMKEVEPYRYAYPPRW